MPAAEPLEFRRGAVGLARRREKSIAEIAHRPGIAESWARGGAPTVQEVVRAERAPPVRCPRVARAPHAPVDVVPETGG
jgi:hypothetical protein